MLFLRVYLIPPVLNATTGKPQACASIVAKPCVSALPPSKEMDGNKINHSPKTIV